MSDFYRDEILFEAANPRHRGVIEGAQIVERRANPSCGDVITVSVAFDEMKGGSSTIGAVKFDGHGCVLSQAGASLMAQMVKGMTVDETLALTREDVFQWLDVTVGPLREGCVMLGLDTIKRGLEVWQKSLK